jgi:tetratricopeptide (TPR) repeat protein
MNAPPRLRRYAFAVLTLATVSALPWLTIANDQTPTYQALMQLESSGDLRAAVQLAGQLSELNDVQTAHVERLKAVELALERSRLLHEAELLKEAEAELDQVWVRLGRQDDLYLMLQVQQRRKALGEPARVEARKELDLVQALIDANKPDEAIVRANALLERTPEKIENADRERALKLKVDAQILKDAPSEPSGLVEVIDVLFAAFTTLTKWLFYFAVLIAAFSVARFARWITSKMTRRPGTMVSLEDCTAPAEQREQQSRALTRDLATAIRRIESAPAESESPVLDWDAAELVFGPSSLGEVASLSTYVQETDIEVGPIKFNARKLFSWISSLFRPRYQYALTGALNTCGVTALTVEQRDANGQPVRGAFFTATAEGDQARWHVVHAVGTQVALFLADIVATDSWRSLDHFLRAEEMLSKEVEPGTRREGLTDALKELELSLRHDEANWMARFRFAGVLRTLGRFISSADQYEYLHSRLMNSLALRQSEHFQKHLERQPDFAWMVRYNEAVSRCRVGWPSETGKARDLTVQLFDQLDRPTDADGSVPSQDVAGRQRREVLARSLRAECWTMRLEHLRDEPKTNEMRKEMKMLVRDIKEDEYWLWSQVRQLNRHELSEYTRAHMVARNALGRAYYLSGRYRAAVKFLRWALDFHVSAPNISAKLNLASVYLRRKRRISPQWVEEARLLLKDVVQIDPKHCKARYLLGRLYADPAVGNLEEAKKQFEGAGDDPLSLFERGRLAMQHENDVPRGLALVRRSLQRRPHLDHRHFLVISFLMKHLQGGGTLTVDDLEFALDLAKKLRAARKSAFRDKANEAIPVLQQNIAGLAPEKPDEDELEEHGPDGQEADGGRPGSEHL